MAKIQINGIEYYTCLDCGCWTSGLCSCREESKSKELVKLMEIFRKKNNYFLFVMPSQKETKVSKN